MSQRNATPSLGTPGTTLPSNAGSLAPKTGTDTTGVRWGVDNTLSGWIVQSEDITCANVTDVTQDQKGAVVSEMDYDRRWDLTLTLIGGTGGTGDGTEDSALPLIGTIDFSYAGHKWKIDSITYNGQYESKKVYSIQAHRYYQFPDQG